MTAATVGTTQAQYNDAYADLEPDWEWNVNSGVLLVNDEIIGPTSAAFNEAGEYIGQEEEFEDALVVGTRLMRHTGGPLSFGGQFSWSPREDAAMDVLLYSAEASFVVPMNDVHLFLASGVGGATTLFSEDEILLEENEDTFGKTGAVQQQVTVVREDQTNVFVPVTLGLKWFLTDDWALTAKARDNLIIDPTSPIQNAEELGLPVEDDNTVNNLQFSAGISLSL